MPPPAPFRPGRPPGPAALAALAAVRLAWRPVQTVKFTNELVRVLPTVAPAVSNLVGGLLGLNRGDGEVIQTTPGRAPATPFNRQITPHRRLALRSVDLDTVKAVKNAFGVSVNDVVMAMCAGALRRWLADHDALPDAPLIAMIPVSVRDPSSKTAMGNKVSAMLASLPTNAVAGSRPSEVQGCACRDTDGQGAAGRHSARPGRPRSATSALPALTAEGGTGRVRDRRAAPGCHLFNLCISNVPGPNVPVYLQAGPSCSRITRCR